MKPWPPELPPLPVATPDDRPVALLMRHAERPSIAPGEHGTDLSLTASGRLSAELLGATLGARILSISTSPVRRCRETAEALRRGANIEVGIVDDHLLGDPGVFVLDPELAWTHWKTLGHEAVVEHIAHEDPPLPGLAPARSAALRLAQHLLLALRAPPAGLHIFVTHDAVLYPMITRLLSGAGRSWPDFLEASALWKDELKITLAYRQSKQGIQKDALTMNQLDAPLLALPPELQALYEAARTAYISADHAKALRLNENLHRASTDTQCTLGQIVGQRFMGLCQYRLGELSASLTSLETALEIAKAANCVEQILLIQNHRAGTLISMGRLEDAHEVLTDALTHAPLVEHPHPHARLLGNMGSLWDVLGQRAAADDCYARFEVLARLLRNKHRLANAVGLTARSAEFRGDYLTAETKYREETSLAAEVNDPLRRVASKVHLARIMAHPGVLSTSEQHDANRRVSGAEALFREAIQEAANLTSKKRYADSLAEYGNFLREQGRPVEAHRYLNQALAASTDPEKHANINHHLALVCLDAGLYGESLEYLMRSADTRAKLYEPLRKLKRLSQTRLDELKGITDDLASEAFTVARSEETQERLKTLVVTVRGDPNAWKKYSEVLDTRSKTPLSEQLKTAQARSLKIWRGSLLSPPEYAMLAPQCQALLHRAERSYSNTVDDLGRSVHLLVLVLEIELNRRLFAPAIARLSRKKKPNLSFGSMLDELQLAIRAKPPSEPYLAQVHAHIRQHINLVRRIHDVQGKIKPLRGPTLNLVKIRNGVAHGNEAILNSLDRLQADAIKRHLALEAPEGGLTVFQALALLPVLP